jgi:hypothetical protein
MYIPNDQTTHKNAGTRCSQANERDEKGVIGGTRGIDGHERVGHNREDKANGDGRARAAAIQKLA